MYLSLIEVHLGWKYNMVKFKGQQHNYTLGCIHSDGDFYGHGGNNNNGQFGMGDGQSGNARRGSPKNVGFTFTDWMTSADNKDLAYDNEFTGNMVTPDGEAPKCIQHVSSNNTSWWLMNNGEDYSAGYNSHYQLGYNEGGNTNTSDRNYTNRVS